MWEEDSRCKMRTDLIKEGSMRRNDHNHKYEAYCITDDLFHSFITNNRRWIDKINTGEVLDVGRRYENSETKASVCSTDLLQHPWSIRYIGKVAGGEGDDIVFLDEGMNKIYSYYDVM